MSSVYAGSLKFVNSTRARHLEPQLVKRSRCLVRLALVKALSVHRLGEVLLLDPRNSWEASRHRVLDQFRASLPRPSLHLAIASEGTGAPRSV